MSTFSTLRKLCSWPTHSGLFIAASSRRSSLFPLIFPGRHFRSISVSCHLSRTANRSSITMPPAAVATVTTGDEKRDFLSCFTDVVRVLTEVGQHKELNEANKWYSKVLHYNTPGGKLNRGLAVPCTYRMLAPHDQHTPEMIHLTCIVGWCVELLQAFFLVMDDIMDGSQVRRGRPAWHTVEDVGLSAVNDAILLEASIYKLLRLYCHQLPTYQHILDLFHKTTLKTSLGQSLDFHSSKQGKIDLSKYTMERYRAIVKYKTSYYSFHLPVALALYLAGVDGEEIHRQARTILLEMGHLFQVQDDYLDCFGDPMVTGKVGTDIRDGKCSWLVVVALQRASAGHRHLLQENYGLDDDEAVARVKSVFDSLDLANIYWKYELNTYEMICRSIEQISRGVPHQVFYKLLEKIYHREK